MATTTLDEIRRRCARPAPAAHGVDIVFRQTNHEGELIDWVQEARDRGRAVVINPAGYGHTSVALLDALKTLDHPDRSSAICPIRRRAKRSAITPMSPWPRRGVVSRLRRREL